MGYDQSRLIVWPEWESSGIWYPHTDTEISAVSMVRHESLELPQRLAKRFVDWIKWYDNYRPEKMDAFPWDAFGQEGKILAIELAKFVGDKYQVEYEGKKITYSKVIQ